MFIAVAYSFVQSEIVRSGRSGRSGRSKRTETGHFPEHVPNSFVTLSLQAWQVASFGCSCTNNSADAFHDGAVDKLIAAEGDAVGYDWGKQFAGNDNDTAANHTNKHA
jgi:hypothetical protein